MTATVLPLQPRPRPRLTRLRKALYRPRLYARCSRCGKTVARRWRRLPAEHLVSRFIWGGRGLYCGAFRPVSATSASAMRLRLR